MPHPIVHAISTVKAKDQADEKEAIDKVNQQEDVGFANAMAEAFKAAKGE